MLRNRGSSGEEAGSRTILLASPTQEVLWAAWLLGKIALKDTAPNSKQGSLFTLLPEAQRTWDRSSHISWGWLGNSVATRCMGDTHTPVSQGLGARVFRRFPGESAPPTPMGLSAFLGHSGALSLASA